MAEAPQQHQESTRLLNPEQHQESTPLLNPEEEGNRIKRWEEKIDEFVRCPFLSPPEIVRDLVAKDVYKFEGPPKTKLNTEEEKAQQSFFPIVVPIGPSHYDIDKSSFFIEGNVLKVDAIRFVIENGDPSEKDWERRFQTLIEYMTSKEGDIRKYYELSQMSPCLKGKIFAWLTIVDCCFLLAMWSVLSEEIEVSEGPSYSDYVKDGDILQSIIEDMIKLQNQMPLWVVKEVAQGLPGWEPGVIKEECLPEVVEEVTHGLPGMEPQVVEVVTRLPGTEPQVVEEVTHYGLPGWEPAVVEVVAHNLPVPIPYSDIKKHFISRRIHMPKLLKRINPHGNDGDYFSLLDDDKINSSHLLRLLHYDVVGNPDDQNMDPLYPLKAEPERKVTSMLTRKLLFECRGFLEENVVLVLLIPFIFPVLIALALPAILVAYILPHPARKDGGIPTLRAEHVFLFLQNIKVEKATILELPDLFDGKKMSLPLLVKASEKEKVLIRNMIALERRNPQLKKIVSNFVYFMSEFLGDSQDVEVLETANILGTHVDENEVVKMWKSLAESATYHNTPYKDPYDPTTELRRNLFNLRKPSRHAVMWYRLGTWYGEFKKQYFSSAWVTVSTVAAIVLLLMTAAQVACLFVTCTRF